MATSHLSLPSISFNNQLMTPQPSGKSRAHSITTTAKHGGKLGRTVRPVKPAKLRPYCNGSLQQTPTNTEDQKFRKLLQAKEKVVKLRFYLQDVLGGYSPTVWEVARAAITDKSPSSYGQVRVVDDLITAEPDRNSEKLGRAQGMITFTGLEESALTMNLNFYFTSGEFSGSTLCVVGRNPISRQNRELPVVGGSGAFRMARGYTISNTYSYDAATNYGVLEYTFYVAYVDEKD